MEQTKATEGKAIYASGKHDPGSRDLFNSVKAKIAAHRAEKMDNLKVVPNDKGLVTSEFEDQEEYKATDHLYEIQANWKVTDQKRNFCLVIEDMQNAYGTYVKYRTPNVKQLIDKFRELKLPIVWTNWARKPDDGLHNAIDRFYGPQGIDEELNPCYVYGEGAHDTLKELAPQTAEEFSRYIVSLHLSKFADYDENGREILFPMLEAWGVNTIVLCGAWTDDCLATTVFDAVDKYGYDIILINNGCATATIHGGKMMEVLYAACAANMSAQEVCDHLNNHPDLIEQPKAPLHGDVRHQKTQYRHDPVLEENEKLKAKIAELEKQLADKQ